MRSREVYLNLYRKETLLHSFLNVKITQSKTTWPLIQNNLKKDIEFFAAHISSNEIQSETCTCE